MAQLIFEPIEKEISGVWMGFKGHRWRNLFSRYGNEILKLFFQYMFVKICWQMKFLSINSVHNQFKNLQWFIFKVLQWNFERFECDLRDVDGATHFWTDQKTILAFEWDLRDIDGATQFSDKRSRSIIYLYIYMCMIYLQYSHVQSTVQTNKHDRKCSKLS